MKWCGERFHLCSYWTGDTAVVGSSEEEELRCE